MSRNKSAVVAVVTAMIVMVVLALVCSDAEVDSPPVDTPVNNIFIPASEATVEVSVYFDNQRSYGKGVVVRHNEQKFVLTSLMILSGGMEYINVESTGWSSIAEILHQNSVLGLVALGCNLPDNTPFVELNDYPSVPPYVQVDINGWAVSTLEYINSDWVLLDNLPKEDCTGYPVTQSGYFIGIVIGMNRINQDQAIMVGNRALKEFCGEATLMNVPLPTPNVVVPVLPSPANPNILFGGGW